MATIALPRPTASGRLSALRGALAHPMVGAGATALLFSGALAALIAMVEPDASSGMRASLTPAFAGAPEGWRQALPPDAGSVVSDDVIRLSERPLAAAGRETPAGPDARLPATVGEGPLPVAPIAGLFASGPGGPLPIIAQDGRTPFEAYARPFAASGRPKIALVIGGLGLNPRATQAAIETLPGEVTLSFSPYAEGLQGWIDLARAHGHEVLLETPMEPVDYPENDPGPYTLMSGAQTEETVKRLEWILSRATGYFGLTNYLGSRFLANDAAYGAFAGALRGRGLGFIDDGGAGRRTGGDLPRASAERVIDRQLAGAAIDQQLLALEASALQRGQALGAGFAYPATLQTVAQWAASVEERGYQLAPASALAVKK